MKVDYCCDHTSVLHHYQTGAGFSSNFFAGRSQSGHGLGSLFKSFGRAVLPLISKGAKAIGKQLIHTGANVAKDMMDGRSFKESAIARGREGGSRLLGKIIRKRKSNASELPIKASKKRRTSKLTGRRRQKDIFDD